MFLQIENYNKSNEILYLLSVVKQQIDKPISKLGLQKLIYLSVVLSPIKNIIFSIIKFKRLQLGPYSKDIQNIVDHLVAYNLVKITSFKVLYGKNSIAFYEITEFGEDAVNELIKYSKEEEKYWWIGSVVKLAFIYSNEYELIHPNYTSKIKGIDLIVKLVYQEPNFKQVENKYDTFIDLEYKEGPTYELIKFVEKYIDDNKEFFTYKNDKIKAESILLSFFEYLFSSFLNESKS